MTKILSTEKLTPHHTAYTIEAKDAASSAGIGQIMMVRLDGQDRFVPHAIADIGREDGTLTFVTASASTNGGDPAGAGAPSIEVRGPMGRASDPGTPRKVLCVAQNLGVAALYPRLRQYKTGGGYTIVAAGYPSADWIFWRDRLDELSDELYIVTEDGTFGIKGPTKHTVGAICQNVSDIDRAVLVGPLGFLKGCARATRKYGIPTWVSLAAVVDGEQDLGREADTPPFDWHAVADLDAEDADFDALARQIGIPITT